MGEKKPSIIDGMNDALKEAAKKQTVGELQSFVGSYRKEMTQSFFAIFFASTLITECLILFSRGDVLILSFGIFGTFFCVGVVALRMLVLRLNLSVSIAELEMRGVILRV